MRQIAAVRCNIDHDFVNRRDQFVIAFSICSCYDGAMGPMGPEQTVREIVMPAPKSEMMERHAMAQALIDWFRSQGISRDDAMVVMSMVISAIPKWEADEKGRPTL